MIYQIRWATDPGLRGISCSDFRATALPAGAMPDNEGGVALDFGSDAGRDAFLRQLEEYFAARRFTNAADAFDSVKLYAMELASRAQR